MEENKKIALNKAALLRQGLLLQKATPQPKLMRLIDAIRPRKTQFELTRVGHDRDGGYLLPEDFEGVTACFSPGVDKVASFEAELQRRYGIGSHLADFSVEGPPQGFSPLSFSRKYVGSHDAGPVMSINRWVQSSPEFRQPGDFILQMDIEGAEYEALLAIRRLLLRRFRMLVIEFHDVESWACPAFFRIVSSIFAKLLQDFVVVHNHPNNHAGLVNIGGLDAPRVFELTLLRRDRATPVGLCHDFPHPQDRPNFADRPDVVLPAAWHRPMRRAKAAATEGAA